MAPSKISSGDARVDVVPSDDVGTGAPLVCARCGRRLGSGVRRCPYDGEVTTQPVESDGWVGCVIDGRYVVRSVLGHGGMGIVYAVRHLKLGRPLALKVLRRDLACDADLCKRFIQEARAAAAVNHPGVVQITDFGVLTSGQPYFVMELLNGRSLSRLMAQERPLPIERWVAIVDQLVEALDAAHAVNVIHRDLKPDNIHVATDSSHKDVIKVLDFGLARIAGATRLTKQGFVFGTPHYMSPEQAQGDPVDHRADIYALGVLMYEMATGRVPFDAESYMGVLTKHISMPVVPPSKILGHRGLGALELVVLRCLEKRSHKRYQSLRELAEDLRVAVRRTPNGIQVAPRSALSVRRWSPERVVRGLGRPRAASKRLSLASPWPVAALLAVGVGGLGWWAFGASGDRPPAAKPDRIEAAAPLPGPSALSDTHSPATTVPVGRKPGATAPAAELPRQRVSIESARAEAAADVTAQPLTVRPKRSAAPKRPGPAPLPTTDIVDPWADGNSP